MERLVIDIMGLFFFIKKKNLYFFVVGDYFIKWVDVFFIKN